MPPPHIAWPGAVILLLLMNVTVSIGTLILSRADGGAQVVEEYYQKAVDWDERAALIAGSEALGWEVEIATFPARAGIRSVQLVVRDREGEPVTGLAGSVRALRPHLTAAVGEAELAEDPASPGAYSQELPVDREGVWDFELTARRDTDVFVKTIRNVIE